MDGSLVWSNRYHQSGTLMPSGAVHPIFASQRVARGAPDDRLSEDSMGSG
jgi:hypothetical protein